MPVPASDFGLPDPVLDAQWDTGAFGMYNTDDSFSFNLDDMAMGQNNDEDGGPLTFGSKQLANA
jgi:hypothetical protein